MTRKFGQEFKIESAVISSERLSDDYDIKSYILEFSLFEDIETPYLTGQLVSMDDVGSFDEMALKGTEQIRITLSGVEEKYKGVKVTLTMNIVSILKRVKTAERTEVYHMNLIAPMAYRDNGIKISNHSTVNLTTLPATS